MLEDEAVHPPYGLAFDGAKAKSERANEPTNQLTNQPANESTTDRKTESDLTQFGL